MWEVSWESPRGAQTFVITFEQDGMELTGTAQMRRGEGTVSDGMIHGNEVSFTLSMGGGRFTLTFKGEVDGDTMAGTLTTPRGASPSASVSGRRIRTRSHRVHRGTRPPIGARSRRRGPRAQNAVLAREAGRITGNTWDEPAALQPCPIAFCVPPVSCNTPGRRRP